MSLLNFEVQQKILNPDWEERVRGTSSDEWRGHCQDQDQSVARANP